MDLETDADRPELARQTSWRVRASNPLGGSDPYGLNVIVERRGSRQQSRHSSYRIRTLGDIGAKWEHALSVKLLKQRLVREYTMDICSHHWSLYLEFELVCVPERILRVYRC